MAFHKDLFFLYSSYLPVLLPTFFYLFLPPYTLPLGRQGWVSGMGFQGWVYSILKGTAAEELTQQ